MIFDKTAFVVILFQTTIILCQLRSFTFRLQSFTVGIVFVCA